MRGGFVVALYRLCRNAGKHSIVWDILVYNSICPDYHIVAYMHRLNNLHAGAYIAVVANHTAPHPDIYTDIQHAVSSYAGGLIDNDSTVMRDQKSGAKLIGIDGKAQLVRQVLMQEIVKRLL